MTEPLSMSSSFTSEGAADGELVLVCDRCGAHICAVEEGDDLDIIVQTAADHGEEGCSAS